MQWLHYYCMTIADAFDNSDIADDIFDIAERDAATPLTDGERAEHLAFFDDICMGCLSNTERPYSPDSRPELDIRSRVATAAATAQLDYERYTRAGATVAL